MYTASSVWAGKLNVSDLLIEVQQKGGDSIFFSLPHLLVLVLIYFMLEPYMSYYSLKTGRSFSV